jgi:transposase
MDQLGFKGLTNPSDRRIVVMNDQHGQVILVEGRPYMRWPVYDTLTKRIAVAQLYALDMGSQEQIAEAFGISAKSVSNYTRMFTAKGSAGLVGGKHGPKSRWKINPSVRAKILHLFLREGIVEYEKIKTRLAGWGEEVGITSIRQVLIENGLVQEGGGFPDLANPVELFHTEDGEDQLYLDFRSTEGGDRDAGAAQSSELDCLPAAAEQSPGDVFAQAATRAKRYYSPGQRMRLDQLKQGSYNSYAGGLLFSSRIPRLTMLPVVCVRI